MQYSIVALLALAASVSATSNATASAVWVTDVVTELTTVCPAATTFSHNGVTYTATESETITITNCPCTISKPVYTTSSVVCETCSVVPTPSVIAPSYTNATVTSTSKGSVGTGSVGTSSALGGSSTATPSPSTISSSGANNLIALSGASLAGLLGVAAYIL